MTRACNARNRSHLRVLHNAKTASNKLRYEIDDGTLQQRHGHCVHINIGGLYLRVREMASSTAHTGLVSGLETKRTNRRERTSRPARASSQAPSCTGTRGILRFPLQLVTQLHHCDFVLRWNEVAIQPMAGRYNEVGKHGKRRVYAHTSAALSVISNMASSGGTNSTSGSSSSSSSSRVSEGEGYETNCVLCEGGRCAMAARVNGVETNVLRVFLGGDVCESPES